MYPAADVPVLQLSVYMEQSAEYHFKLGERLRSLREQGILIVGSGNIVHNLSTIRWDLNAEPHAWAIEFDQWVKEHILKRNFIPLLRNAVGSIAGQLSIPSPDHWYPLLYALGASDDSDRVRFEYEGIENGSISMRTVSFGAF